MLKRIFVISAALCLLFTGTQAFAAGDYTVYTWGYGDIMYNMLEAVKMVLGTDNFKVAFKLAMLLSLLVITLSLISDKTFSPFLVGQKVIMVILIQVLVSSNPHDLYIFDETRDGVTNTPAYKVENVPAVIGLPLYIISNMERGLAHAFRDSLAATPAGVLAGNAANGAVIPITTALNMLQSTSSFRIGDPAFMRTMHNYVENCVVPDIISGYIDIYEVGTSADFWAELARTRHYVRFGNNFMADPVTGAWMSREEKTTYANGVDIKGGWLRKNGRLFRRKRVNRNGNRRSRSPN